MKPQCKYSKIRTWIKQTHLNKTHTYTHTAFSTKKNPEQQGYRTAVVIQHSFHLRIPTTMPDPLKSFRLPQFPLGCTILLYKLNKVPFCFFLFFQFLPVSSAALAILLSTTEWMRTIKVRSYCCWVDKTFMSGAKGFFHDASTDCCHTPRYSSNIFPILCSNVFSIILLKDFKRTMNEWMNKSIN